MSLRLLLVGRGRLGRLVEELAPSSGATIAGVITRDNAATLGDAGRWKDVDVIVEVSRAQPFLENLPALCGIGANLVVGTTGWQAEMAQVRARVEAAGIGAVVASNFSVGANVMEALAERAGALLAAHEAYGGFIHEAHHAAKKDAPSGTALTLRAAVERGGFARPVDMASTRAGFIPGIHTVGFDGPAETIALTHTVRDRATFAQGALVAARWVQGRRGWFTMRDVLGM
jgi:4-hydroxy-tetrahydrodipicolinate reductase